ncbi:DUF4168 domain-containing protein [Reichenbachiella ulvae]|uniref:DUF4168 domain-containing protein n=1 Tax=Reichenbachiella ulvae TaxID=2980104 RepID=A0ABT3CRC9_9BACT|nr:DUF4168 domain-containing protein [Reichenbachiella ulvae]MCV9386089.1 hypothetical protein [Reichenbachiella ulvae]
MKRVLTTVLLFVAVFTAKAQDEISKEDLTKYAKVMLAIDSLKAGVQDQTNDLVKNDPLMDGGRTFNAIKTANGDEAKLAEAEITPEELAAYDSILVKIDELKANFKEAYTSAIKDDLGAGLYNDIRKALKSDADLKTAYDEIVASLKEETVSEEESES